MAVTLDELVLADSPDSWEACGFRVEDGTCVLGDVRIRMVPKESGGGLVHWSLRGAESVDSDGLPTVHSDQPPPEEAPTHPNGVTSLDHVVAISSDLDRTVAALEAVGLDLRRIR